MGKMKDFKEQQPSFATPREESGMLGALERPPETNKTSISSFGMRLQLHRDPGIFFGIAVDDENPQSYRDIVLVRHYVGRPQSTEGHCAVFGSSGSGKGSCIAVPTMVSWGNSPMIVLDPKGDLSEYYIKMRCADKRPIKIFNPARDDTCTYDPFSHIRNDDESNRVANIWELVNAIIPASLDGKDRFWISAAQKILTGAFLYFLDLSDDDTELMDFYTAIDCITSLPFEGKVGEEDGLFERIKKSGNAAAQKYIRAFMGKNDLSKSEMLMDINETLDTYLMNFVNDMRIRKALTPSQNSIDWENDIDKYSIFLSVPEDRIEQWGPLLNVMITQLIRTLERRPEHYSPQGADLKPVLLLLDEFPMIGRVDVLANALSMLRSKNVTILLIAQSISQLSAIYGHDCRNIMLENCDFQAVLRVNCAESQKYFSDLAGTVPVWSWGINDSYGPTEKSGTQHMSHSENASVTYQPFVRPEELAHLDKEMILFTPYRTFRIKKSPFYEWKENIFAPLSNLPEDEDSVQSEKKHSQRGSIKRMDRDGFTFKISIPENE